MSGESRDGTTSLSRDGNTTSNGRDPSDENESSPVAPPAADGPPEMGDMIKSIVYGGMDGIITTFAIVCAVCGANLGTRALLLMGVANLVADGISMGMGDYISEKAEEDFAVMKKRELSENDCPQQQEKDNMIHLFEQRGVTRADATIIINTMAKYQDLFVDHVMMCDLGIPPPTDEPSTAAQKGFVTFMSFITFGSVPLMVFGVKDFLVSIGMPFSPLVMSSASSALTMFTLGAIKGRLTAQNMVISGVFMAAHGLMAAYAAYAIGWGMDALLSSDGTPQVVQDFVAHAEL
uniref:Uncharacterized protein n=1 Tax=Octactis speculum TaxID=3111310 RepID=A0A7S2BMM4_9STRA|mmetsp:Transcript_24988/g.34226  ORF Transcript_24988/g.34226 Transcript_24988/m.34226 type:complete len:292 (+) Transcript_24988:73-948(+)